MKKNFISISWLTAIACMFLVSFSVVSCSDDDDDNGGGSTAEVENPLVKDGKMLLTSIYSEKYGEELFQLKYDELFRPYFASEDDGDAFFYIDYKNNKMSFWDMEGLSVSFNNKGYITKIEGSYSETEDGETDSGKLSQIFSYDGNGHLTSIDVNSESTYSYDGTTEYWKEIVKHTFTWNDGNLTKIESNATWYDEHGNIDESESGCDVSTYTYGNQKNKYKQYPYAIMQLTADEEPFFASGLFGVGPDYLPLTSSMSEGNGSYNSADNCTYTLNEDGSIDTETLTDVRGNYSEKYKYRHTPIDAYTANPAKAYLQNPQTRATSAFKRNLPRKGLFMPKRHKQTHS